MSLPKLDRTVFPKSCLRLQRAEVGEPNLGPVPRALPRACRADACDACDACGAAAGPPRKALKHSSFAKTTRRSCGKRGDRLDTRLTGIVHFCHVSGQAMVRPSAMPPPTSERRPRSHFAAHLQGQSPNVHDNGNGGLLGTAPPPSTL